ncbi:MAG: ABC transporter permease [Xanthomonadaceae bacterium]|nr:ABC transporter permease [Xanthomonadaceae bacterium]
MNALTMAARTTSSSPSTIRIYWLETRNEFLRMLRTPMFALPTLLFPLVFYVMFGVLLNRGGGNGMGAYLLATYGVFGVMGAAMFGFGATVAMERTQGMLRLKRALPTPPGAYLFAKTGMAMLFVLMISLCLLAVATTLGKVALTPTQAALLVVVNLLGSLPFAALGLYVGTWSSANGAPAILNMIMLPMAFLSGLWLPLSILPAWLQTIAPVWPSYHLSQIALKVLGRDAGQPLWLHIAVLVLVTVVFAVLARSRLARSE